MRVETSEEAVSVSRHLSALFELCFRCLRRRRSATRCVVLAFYQSHHSELILFCFQMSPEGAASSSSGTGSEEPSQDTKRLKGIFCCVKNISLII